MPVDTVHPDYKNAAKRWELIRAIVNNNARNYIRTPDENDPLRSAQYKDDAILTNFTSLTKTGLVGLVFRKPPKIELPKVLNYLYDDVTGGGVNIWQLSQYITGEVLQLGRFGILIDYYQDGKAAYLKPYCPENIINWKTTYINGECVLSLVVLTEDMVQDSEDIFSQDTKKQYRVLRLDKNNNYIQEEYNENKELINTILVTDYNGTPFNYIPFVFIGSENNDWAVDPQPLYDMAIVNLGHYRNSADYEESIYICGQPYPVVTIGDASIDDFNSANPNGVLFGSRKGLVLPTNGSASLLQANANQLVAQAMKEKLEQARAIGARLIAPSTGRETAEAAKTRYGSQHSALYTLTSNISWAMTLCLEIAAMFMTDKKPKIVYQLNSQFYDETADPNLIAQQLLCFDRGIIGKQEIIDYGRKTGWIDDLRTDEDIAADAEMIDPLAGGANNVSESDTAPSTSTDAAS